jgi:hypothetical protein
VWGLVGIFLSLALGATLIRVTNAELPRLTAEALHDDQPATAATTNALAGVSQNVS